MPKYFLRDLHHAPTSYAVPSILISVLFFALPLIYWHQLYEAASLPRYFLLGLGGSTVLLLWVISKPDKPVIWHSGFSLILGFFGWAAISTSWSPDAGTSLIDITQLFSMIVLAFLAMQLFASPIFRKLIVSAILVGAALAALIGVGQYFDFNPLGLRKNPGSLPSTFINPNHAAVYFDFIPPLSFTAIFFYQRPALRWLASLALGLSLTFLIMNTSRGSVLAFCAVLLALLLVVLFKPEIKTEFKLGLRTRYKEMILAVLIPLLVLFPLPGEENSQTGKATINWNTELLEGKIDKSTSFRFAIYINSLPAILNQPFTGIGYGGMRVGFQPYTTRILPTTFRTEDMVLRELHSDPLQYFVELGLPGGLLAMTIFIILLRSGWKGLSSPQLEAKKLLVLGLWLGLIACGVHSLVDFPLRLPASAAMFWLFAGILLGLSGTQHSSIGSNSFRLARPFIFVMAIIGIIFNLTFYKAYLASNHNLYNTIVSLKKEECLAAAKAAEDGLETFASDFMLITAYAQVYSVCSFPPSEQLAAMNRVLALDPSNLRALLTRGDLFNQANKPELAVADFEKIAVALPHRPSAYAGLGDSARLEGDIPKARHYYLAALQRNSDFEYVKRRLGMLEPSLAPK